MLGLQRVGYYALLHQHLAHSKCSLNVNEVNGNARGEAGTPSLGGNATCALGLLSSLGLTAHPGDSTPSTGTKVHADTQGFCHQTAALRAWPWATLPTSCFFLSLSLRSSSGPPPEEPRLSTLPLFCSAAALSILHFFWNLQSRISGPFYLLTVIPLSHLGDKLHESHTVAPGQQ